MSAFGPIALAGHAVTGDRGREGANATIDKSTLPDQPIWLFDERGGVHWSVDDANVMSNGRGRTLEWGPG